jgi:hypothetical protein
MWSFITLKVSAGAAREKNRQILVGAFFLAVGINGLMLRLMRGVFGQRPVSAPRTVPLSAKFLSASRWYFEGPPPAEGGRRPLPFQKVFDCKGYNHLIPFPIINFLFGRRPAPKGRWPPRSPLHIKKALASKWYKLRERFSPLHTFIHFTLSAQRGRRFICYWRGVLAEGKGLLYPIALKRR